MILVAFVLAGCAEVQRHPSASADRATFKWFQYSGTDPVFASPMPAGQYQNPIIAGFYPDPSIVRVDDTYYMVHSSFAYFPGIPIFKSHDLVNWESLGYVLDRPDQIQLNNIGTSRGIFAPTIRYHDGLFYVITTNVDGPEGNFIVTAEDPAGEWSDPVSFPEIQGIDPSVFFDNDGRAYLTHNGAPEGEPLYEGHRAIWLWEWNPQEMKVIADSGRVIVNGGTDLSREPIWIEAPHLYKVNGWYYLICAEGGTGEDHSAVVFRTRSLDTPFEPYDDNPILTQRDLPRERENPISAAGHADLVQTQHGDWWAVFLATRPYDGTHFHLGRETFLLPVTWRDGWPHILPQGHKVPHRLDAPALKSHLTAAPMTGNFDWRDDFDGQKLDWRWSFLRTPNTSLVKLDPRMGLQLTASTTPLHALEPSAFVGRRQQHHSFNASTEVAWPVADGKSGLVVYQNEEAYLFLSVTQKDPSLQAKLTRRDRGTETVVNRVNLPTSPDMTGIQLFVESDGPSFRFSAQVQSGDIAQPKIVIGEANSQFLSTSVAGGFVGNFIGLHAVQDGGVKQDK